MAKIMVHGGTIVSRGNPSLRAVVYSVLSLRSLNEMFRFYIEHAQGKQHEGEKNYILGSGMYINIA
jgi:hypothetical protein